MRMAGLFVHGGISINEMNVWDVIHILEGVGKISVIIAIVDNALLHQLAFSNTMGLLM